MAKKVYFTNKLRFFFFLHRIRDGKSLFNATVVKTVSLDTKGKIDKDH